MVEPAVFGGMKTLTLTFLVIIMSFAFLGSFSVSFAADYEFNHNLTIGSTGADVVALQTFLEDNFFMTMPSGVAKGYFGPITRQGVARLQTINHIAPTFGYFGPITRARINSGNVVIIGIAHSTPSISVSPTSGVAGTDVDISIAGLRGFNTNNRVDVIFGNSSGTSGHVYNLDSLNSAQNITFEIPMDIHSVCSNSSYGCTPQSVVVKSGVYQIYLSIPNDDGTTASESNKIDFRVTAR